MCFSMEMGSTFKEGRGGRIVLVASELQGLGTLENVKDPQGVHEALSGTPRLQRSLFRIPRVPINS